MNALPFWWNSVTISLMNYSEAKKIFKQSATYTLARVLVSQADEFFETLGEMGIRAIQVFKQIFKDLVRREMNWKLVVEQCSRFAVDSLPITLSIVGMCSIIISMQVAPEMVKQGGEKFVGMLMGVVMTREMGAIMAGFAIISMIGSAYASEIATMRVTEQIDALKVLKVNPIEYLFVPRVVAAIIMMPFVVVLASTFGIICGGVAAYLSAHVSKLNYISSLWQGLYVKDIMVALLKSAFFGGTIAIISCTCGYLAYGGAKGVGISTTKAVVWSFVAICIIDYIFATIFFL